MPAWDTNAFMTICGKCFAPTLCGTLSLSEFFKKLKCYKICEIPKKLTTGANYRKKECKRCIFYRNAVIQRSKTSLLVFR